MKKKPVLVVLAAGMGSRYGGLKQIDPMGSQGEAILDYSIYDAHRAGFDTVVIVIKKEIEQDFKEIVGKRLEKAPVEIRYAYQELDDLPEGFTVPEGRTKPWGTSHAVLCAKEAIDGAPFAVINADDYYGASAYRVVYDYLTGTEDPNAHCMVGYELGKTVTDYGSVSRGICEVDEEGMLTKVTERKVIEKYEKGDYPQQAREYETDIAIADEEMKRAAEKAAPSSAESNSSGDSPCSARRPISVSSNESARLADSAVVTA